MKLSLVELVRDYKRHQLPGYFIGIMLTDSDPEVRETAQVLVETLTAMGLMKSRVKRAH